MSTPTVPCPQCKTKVIWDKNSVYRPFCSKRCQVLDLGAWASEQHVIPEADTHNDFSFSSEEDEFL